MSEINIKKSNRGKFTESAKRAGMGVQEYARHVLANKGNYDATTVRRANFARNAKKWHHADGGLLYNPFNFGGYIPLDGVVQLPPQYGLGGTIDYEDVMPIGGAIRTRFKEKASPFRNLKQTLKAMPTRGEWMARISENIYPQSNRPVREKVNKGDYVPELTLPLNIDGSIVYGTGNMPAWYDYQQQVETRNPYSCGGRIRKFTDGGELNNTGLILNAMNDNDYLYGYDNLANQELRDSLLANPNFLIEVNNDGKSYRNAVVGIANGDDKNYFKLLNGIGLIPSGSINFEKFDSARANDVHDWLINRLDENGERKYNDKNIAAIINALHDETPTGDYRKKYYYISKKDNKLHYSYNEPSEYFAWDIGPFQFTNNSNDKINEGEKYVEWCKKNGYDPETLEAGLVYMDEKYLPDRLKHKNNYAEIWNNPDSDVAEMSSGFLKNIMSGSNRNTSDWLETKGRMGERIFEHRPENNGDVSYYDIIDPAKIESHSGIYETKKKRINAAAKDVKRNSQADFIQRLRMRNPESIPDWENPEYHSSHKMGSQDNIVFPYVQNINGELIDFTNPVNVELYGDPFETAISNSDAVIFPNEEMADKYATNYYKKFFRTTKKDYREAKRNGELKGCGGHLKADGGDLGRSNGAYWPSGLTYVDAGGTHEQNPNEGVQMGEDNQGTPNLVEQGEVIYNDYVFSNRLTPNKSFFENGKKGKNDLAGLIGLLPKKYKRNTYAKIAEDMGKEIRGRENDPISKRGLERNLSNLEALQETQRAMNGRKGTQQLQTPGYDMAQQPVQQYGMDQYGMQNEIQPIQETGIGTSMEQQPMIGGLGGRLHGRKFGGEENTNQPNYALRVAQSRRKNYPLSVYDSYVPENDYMYNYINQDYLDQLENGTPIVDMFHLGFTPRYGLQWSPVNVPPVYIYQGGNGSAGSNGSAGGNGGSGSYQTSSSNNSEVPVMESANANDNGNSAGTNNPVATVEGNGQSNSVPVIPQYSTQPEKSNIPEYDTRLRYAPVAGSLLSALGTVLQPLDLQEANDLFRMAGNVRTPSVRARMLSNYVKPRLMDRNYALNPVLANAGATRRMINGTNGGNRMAGLVAAGYNAQNAVGNTLAQVNDYNNKILLNAAQFNRATDQYNSQQALSADTANAGYMMNAQQLRNNLLTDALGERGRQKDARGEAISSALSQAYNNLGAIGTQNFNANLANKNPLNRGYYITGQGGVAYDPYMSSLYGLQPSLAASQTTSPAEGQKGTLPNGQEIIFKDGKWDFTSACGGRLMTKKSKRR